ncbi:hypothetical protein IKG24_00140 [Candidatus Saccharibacteria bacterium]|nr:hypothetical protein [Candidatus Saccharibacteria bacterium]
MAFKNVKKIVFLVVPVALVCLFGMSANAEGEAEPSVTEEQKNIIIDHCDTIKDSLKSLQKADSRTRVYLGRYYETILSNFMVPLNIRLVENSISNTKLIENQTNFANRRDRFNSDFISYQQALEELVNINCKNEPERFYTKLVIAREKRAIVSRDVTKLKGFTDEQVKLVQELKVGMGQS